MRHRAKYANNRTLIHIIENSELAWGQLVIVNREVIQSEEGGQRGILIIWSF